MAAVPEEREKLRALKAELGDKVLGEVTLNMAIGGMRGVKGMIWETSLLDEAEGIRFRGHTIEDLQKSLPTAIEGGEPMPEGLLWLLLTGDIPTAEQADSLRAELAARALRQEGLVRDMLEKYPIKTMHPMTQLSTRVLALQPRSAFAAAYASGSVHKTELWRQIYEDALDLIAVLPMVAGHIYRESSGKSDIGWVRHDVGLDWSANYARMMGYESPEFDELLRLYLTIHADHEGGCVSAHTTRLVGSALSDPYLSYAAGMNGLAGPLHGLANQEVLLWLRSVQAELGANPTKEQLTDFVWATLKSGKVVPGYGHAVLRKTDPRYTCQREFALKHLPDDEGFKLVSALYEVVPKVLAETGKVKNPWPNVDAHSGVLLQHYGMTEADYYTVLFGVSRAQGVLAQLVWDRALGLPIERLKSLTMDAARAQLGGQ
eukprot:PRCOL_00005650-RA